MTAKFITLTSLLLMLGSPAFAADSKGADAHPAEQVKNLQEQPQTAQAPQQPLVLAWQRVGAPISLET